MSTKLFDLIQVRKPKTNAFDLSHEKKLTCNIGELIPIFFQEVIPGDKFKADTEIFLRTMPLITPIMHRLNVYTHYFFVPNRLVHKNWPDFITGGERGADASVLPKIVINNTQKGNFVKGQLPDYFGIPPIPGGTTVVGSMNISALPFRAYQLIYNEYYRDQNIVDPIAITLNDTVSSSEQNVIVVKRNRSWEKDYFTSCLPYAQKGDQVELPIDASFSPQYMDTSLFKSYLGNPMDLDSMSNLGPVTGNVYGTDESSPMDARIENLEDPQEIDTVSITINELRVAVRLQEWLEKNMRAGSRYIESILAHFGVRSSDARLQRPEYLGGGKQPISISEVLATGETATQMGGQMFGHGISVGRTHSFEKSFEEHGMIIGIMSVLPRSAYQNGINRYWHKADNLDFAWPEFANLGEQEVKMKELFVNPSALADGEQDFGYQSRYAEYKYAESSVHGDFRDDLDYWHMGRKFDTEPTLSPSFVLCADDMRCWPSLAEDDKLLIQVYNTVKAIRPLPVFGTPML